MNKQWLQHIACLFFIVLLCGCNGVGKKQVRWNTTLNNADKNPYGTYLAYESLHHFFPSSAISNLSKKYRFSSMDDNMNYGKGTNLMVILGYDLELSEQEWIKLRQFARSGNEVVIFAAKMDKKIENDLNCITIPPQDEFMYEGRDSNLNKHVLSLAAEPNAVYGYPGKQLTGKFFSMQQLMQVDTPNADDEEEQSTYYTLADTLGYANGQPDFIRFQLGRGHITLHAAPLVMSNYFLLQEGNVKYLTGIWQSLPAEIDHIYWTDFYRHTAQDSSYHGLWRFPSTRKALYLAFFLMVVYVLFQMKRKQRIIPIIPPLRNDSVSFVETVGRLYFNKGNNANLADKMVLQFLDWVRVHYYLNTNVLNPDFARQLAIRSGQPDATVEGLLTLISEVRIGHTIIDDPYLYQLYNTIQQFYKKDIQ